MQDKIIVSPEEHNAGLAEIKAVLDFFKKEYSKKPIFVNRTFNIGLFKKERDQYYVLEHKHENPDNLFYIVYYPQAGKIEAQGKVAVNAIQKRLAFSLSYNVDTLTSTFANPGEVFGLELEKAFEHVKALLVCEKN